MANYYGSIRTSNTYGGFYNNEWRPATLLQDPNVVKNKKVPKPGRTNEDYGEFYQDPHLKNNIRQYLGGYWGKPSGVNEGGSPSPRDFRAERDVMRSYPTNALHGSKNPEGGDHRTTSGERQRQSYDQLRQQLGDIRTKHMSPGRSYRPHYGQGEQEHEQYVEDRHDGYPDPKFDLQKRRDYKVDPWKSEYVRNYKPDQQSRLPDIKQLDAMYTRRNLGDGGDAFVDEYPKAPRGYLQ